MRSRWSLVLSTLLLGAGTASAGIGPVPFRTGLFGVTAGQKVRVSVLNTGAEKAIINPCFKVWDAAGTLLFESDAGPLPGGAATFADFGPVPNDGVPPPTGVPERSLGERLQIRAEVALELADDSQPSAKQAAALEKQKRHVIVTLEVYDTATGRTAFTMRFAPRAGVGPVPFLEQ